MKWNIPNTLTSLRIVLIPVFLWRFLTAQTREEFYAAAGILVFSGLSDTLDGTIARKCNMITQLGKILDPVADKLTLGAVILALWIKRPHLWPLYVLLIAKEFFMLLGGIKLHRTQVAIQSAKWFGKLSTIVFYLIMIVVVARPDISDGTLLKMLLVLLFFMLFSFVQYVLVFKRLLEGQGMRQN